MRLTALYACRILLTSKITSRKITCRFLQTISTDMVTVEKMKKVELHVHLDGAMRYSTLFEIGKKKKLLKEETLAEFESSIVFKERVCLTKFLKPFAEFMPCIVGDADAIHRIAYEFCEDLSKENVVYCEARYCPQLFAKKTSPYANPVVVDNDVHDPEEVVKLITNAFLQGEKDFNVKVRTLLCCIRECPEWSSDILTLCEKYSDKGVVGIDIAGDENIHNHAIGDKTQHEHISVFQRAKDRGIHRTVHAGENGPAACVREAVYEMYAERLGHGYHTLDDMELYTEVLSKGIHFEVCPLSSYITSSVSSYWLKHPLIRFMTDNANCSISSDDPTLVGHFVSGDYRVCLNQMDLSIEDIFKTNLNAARSSFLPEDEKEELIQTLEIDYGLTDLI